ncbi:MAG TPA: ATP-binding protein [Solirubrobacteraceae bacterium]|jgi:two-component system sensor histidine kinase KdpD|nr:ATP-binding protein [Solirubrobacteraceae bacterium]
MATPRTTPGMSRSAIRGWTTHLGAATLGRQRPQRSTGILAAIGSVALATLAIYFLRKIAPVVSLSVVYLPAVLLVATYWGIALGLFTSLLSAASFNFFHIPPTGKFTIVDGRNWVALAAFTIVALFASALAEVARSRAQEAERRRAEADLAAALAHELLLGEDTQAALASAGRRVAEALELTSAAIEPVSGEPTTSAPVDPRRTAFALRGIDGQRMATLLVPANLPPDTEQRLRTQVVPTLEALVAIAQRRDAMQAELVETAALRRSDDIKTALLRTVSHDLRTPLTAVVAAGHALGADSLTGQERSELSAAVVEEGTRLAGLVDNLLALSRLQAGSATPRSDWVSIEDLVSAAAEGLRGDPIDVRVTVDPDVPEIRADAAQLERAFANLLENAGRYGGGSPVVVHARRGGGTAGEGVLISITDQGPGIDAAEQERIFEPFYRGRNVGSLAWTGSGLGLAIVKGFVEANGGSITVQSFPGQGTTFYVLLPVEEHQPVGAATR